VVPASSAIPELQKLLRFICERAFGASLLPISLPSLFRHEAATRYLTGTSTDKP